MDKEQALQAFWGGFGWKAYDEATVPDDAEIPRITYSVSVDSLDRPVLLTASLWDKSYSWESVTKKSKQIAKALRDMYPPAFAFDDGRIYLTPGQPFAQRMSDSNDDSIRRIYLNIEAEYFSDY